MKKYVCDVCGYIYDEAIGDPDNGIEAGTKWEDVPDDFLCPLCGVGKDQFSEAEQHCLSQKRIKRCCRPMCKIGAAVFLSGIE